MKLGVVFGASVWPGVFYIKRWNIVMSIQNIICWPYYLTRTVTLRRWEVLCFSLRQCARLGWFRWLACIGVRFSFFHLSHALHGLSKIVWKFLSTATAGNNRRILLHSKERTRKFVRYFACDSYPAIRHYPQLSEIKSDKFTRPDFPYGYKI